MKNNLLRLAKSQPLSLKSSETIRKASLNNYFCFNNYITYFKPQHIKNIDQAFLQWFIGFSEGDGSFILSNKRNYFVINQKDIQILYKIKATLGFGQVFKYTKNNHQYGRYVIQDKKNCKLLAYIFNGNLVLEKTNNRFTIWLENLNIQPLEKKGVLQLDNAWLSGFIDAEGCFSARTRKNSNYKLNFKIDRGFSINQKGELPIFYSLKLLFKSNVKIQEISKNNTIYYKLELKSMKSNQILLNYLEQFPCKGKKKIIVIRYRRINGYMERKEHLTKKGLTKIKQLCKKLHYSIN